MAGFNVRSTDKMGRDYAFAVPSNNKKKDQTLLNVLIFD